MASVNDLVRESLVFYLVACRVLFFIIRAPPFFSSLSRRLFMFVFVRESSRVCVYFAYAPLRLVVHSNGRGAININLKVDPETARNKAAHSHLQSSKLSL